MPTHGLKEYFLPFIFLWFRAALCKNKTLRSFTASFNWRLKTECSYQFLIGHLTAPTSHPLCGKSAIRDVVSSDGCAGDRWLWCDALMLCLGRSAAGKPQGFTISPLPKTRGHRRTRLPQFIVSWHDPRRMFSPAEGEHSQMKMLMSVEESLLVRRHSGSSRK